MAFAQIYTSSSPEKKSASPSDALLEGRDALTEQGHTACPKKPLTGGRFPSTCFKKKLKLEHSHACRAVNSVSTGI